MKLCEVLSRIIGNAGLAAEVMQMGPLKHQFLAEVLLVCEEVHQEIKDTMIKLYKGGKHFDNPL